MKKRAFAAILFSLVFVFLISIHPAAEDYHTGFQEWSLWQPGLNLPADIAIVYGDNAAGLKEWKSRGYEVWSMIGASWLGKDAEVVKKHPEIVQRMAGGVPFEMISGRAWVVPVEPWREYIKEMAGRLIQAGATGILPEEPEFFAVNGYSDSFKAEWQKSYGEPWQAPDSSLSAQWKANRLKAQLFAEFYSDVFKYVKRLNKDAVCLIPVHSNLNYADWGIVAPHHAFMSLLDADGMVGQVWTGTAKGTYQLGGRPIQSVFDYSFLEYSYFKNLAASSKKQMWLLTDPVEDAQGATWDDLRGWYESTLTAALMQTGVNRYEVAPWPSRVFLASNIYGGNGNSAIPDEYAAELMTVWSAQRMIPDSGTEVLSGSASAGFLTSDTLMWQRGSGTDRFRGHIAPMLAMMQRGFYVNVLPAERFAERKFPYPDVKVAVASFDAWKPVTPGVSAAIAEWVKGGGTLIFLGGTDDYDSMESAWWHAIGSEAPVDDLLMRLGIARGKKEIFAAKEKNMGADFIARAAIRKTMKVTEDAPFKHGETNTVSLPLPITSYAIDGASVWVKSGEKPVVWTKKCGSGNLVYAGFPGEAVAQTPEGEKIFMEIIRAAMEMTPGTEYLESDSLIVRRGPFVIARARNSELKLDGIFGNILRPEEPVKAGAVVPKGGNAFLLDLQKGKYWCVKKGKACVVLAGGNLSDEKDTGKSFEFVLAGPDGRRGGVWISMDGISGVPASVRFSISDGGESGSIQSDWNQDTGILHFMAPLSHKGTRLVVEY